MTHWETHALLHCCLQHICCCSAGIHSCSAAWVERAGSITKEKIFVFLYVFQLHQNPVTFLFAPPPPKLKRKHCKALLCFEPGRGMGGTCSLH